MMINVKEFKVTEDFLGLDEEKKGCQSQETVEDCRTNKYFAATTSKCGCVPFSLRNYSSPINMNVGLFNFCKYVNE